MTTVLTREYLDVRPDGWLDYAAKRIAQLGADKCYNRSLCEEHLNLILPAKPPFHPRQFRTCAVVGNSGDLLKTEFGHEIDEHDAVFRDNEAPVNEKYARHVGLKRDFRLVVRGAARNMVTILNGSSEEVLIIKSVTHKDFNAMIKVIRIHSPMRAERKQDWSDVPNKELVRSAHAAALRLKQRQTGDLGPFADCKVWGSVDQGGPISGSPGAGELREKSNYNKWELLPIESLRHHKNINAPCRAVVDGKLAHLWSNVKTMMVSSC